MENHQRPHLTVAAIVERDNKLLMVKEFCNGKLTLNQPAGHVENDETLQQAVIRECYEETRWQIKPEYLLGITQFTAPNKITYLRCTIVATALNEDLNAQLDPDIQEACWLSREEIAELAHMHRSSMVANDIKRYEQGFRFELNDLYYVLPHFNKQINGS